MLEWLQQKTSFPVLFAERVQAVTPSSASFAGVGCIRDVVVLELNPPQNSKFKCQACANQQVNIAEDCPGIELNGPSLEIVEKFCYLVGYI